jgi:hypothetical protein
MAEWNRIYPRPDRSDHSFMQDSKREFFPEIDLAAGMTIMSDGRPAVVEDWYEVELGLFCRTAFYSTIGTEGWSEADHYAYLEANGLLEGKTYPVRSLGFKTLIDASGNEVWSTTTTSGTTSTGRWTASWKRRISSTGRARRMFLVASMRPVSTESAEGFL